MSRYILKYNEDGQLYNYVELNNVDSVMAYMKLDGQKVIKYDRVNDTKQLVYYKNPVEMRQRFNDGQSFVTIYDRTKNVAVQYDYPAMEKQITLIHNHISTSDFGKFVIARYKLIQNKK